MEHLGALTAIGSELKIEGVQYHLRTLGVKDWARIQERMNSLRGDPVEAARRLAKDAPEAIARSLLEQAYVDAKRMQTFLPGEVDEWLRTIEGLLFGFWLMLNTYDSIHNQSQPDLTEERVCQLYDKLGNEAIDAFLAAAPAMFPHASEEELADIAAANKDDLLRRVVAQCLGLPSGNSPTPEKPGTPANP